jgi:hypothetical protein
MIRAMNASRIKSVLKVLFIAVVYAEGEGRFILREEQGLTARISW